jgi:hypothetical protein
MQKYEQRLARQASLVSQSGDTLFSNAAQPAAGAFYHKKALVFKRILAQTELTSIRTSALTDGYQALSAIPSVVVAPPVSVRSPQFLDTSALSNYQALSVLGTQQYYSNMNVQQLLNQMGAQQYFYDMSSQAYLNNMNNQQYLQNFNSYLYNQTYLNTQNTFNNQQYLNNYNNYLNNQTFTNNWNTFTSPTFNPPPQIYIPPPTFNTWP